MKIKKFRTKLRLTQEDLAKQLGTTQQTIARWESGKTGVPPKYLKDLAIFLGCSVAQLLESNGTSKRENVDEGSLPYGTIKLRFDDCLDNEENAQIYAFPISEAERIRVLHQLADYDVFESKSTTGWINFTTLDYRFIFLNANTISSVEMLSDDVEAMPAYEHEEVYKALLEIQEGVLSQSDDAPYSDALLRRCEHLMQIYNEEDEDFYRNMCIIVESIKGQRNTYFAEDEVITDIKNIELAGKNISSGTFLNLHDEGWYRSRHFRLSSLRLIMVPLLRYYADIEE